MPFPLSTTTFTTLAANGQTAAVVADVAGEFEATVYLAAATFGSGTLVMQTSFDGGTTWHNIPSASWTSGTANSQLARITAVGPRFRFSLSGATSPSLAITLKLERRRVVDVRQYSFTADADGAALVANFEPSVTAVAWAAQGTFGSGTVRLQVSPDGGTTWFILDSTTSAAVKHAANCTDALLRASVTGSTSPALSVYIAL